MCKLTYIAEKVGPRELLIQQHYNKYMSLGGIPEKQGRSGFILPSSYLILINLKIQ